MCCLALLSAIWLIAGQAASAPAEPVLPLAEKPGWVQTIAVSASTADTAAQRDGIVWLLSDIQIINKPGGHFYYSRNVQEVVDRVGLESASSISITFEPSLEKVFLVALSVQRDGAVIDHRQDARVDLFRSEDDLSRGILTGRKTFSILVPDVKVGDIVDYAIMRESDDMLNGLPFDIGLALNYVVPVERLRRRIVWPSDDPLSIKAYDSGARPAISQTGQNTVYEWDLQKPEPYPDDGNLPPESVGHGWVAVSSAAEWREIVRPLLPHYRTDWPLPEAFKNRLDEIAAKNVDAVERFTEVVRLVQDEIRYVSLSIGYGAILPRAPSEVITSGFGDCKDKAVLLATALRYLKIDATPALTDLDSGESIAALPPSVMAFDHVIVRVRLTGATLWIDATDYSQGGRGFGIEQAHYGYALPVEDGARELEKMAPIYAMLPTQLTEEHYSLPEGDVGALTLKVLTTYGQTDADWFRRKAANDSVDTLAKRYQDYYAAKFDGLVSTAQIKISDNRDANIITVEENYAVPDFDRVNGETIKDFPIKGILNLDTLPEIKAIGRSVPAYIGKPFAIRHVVTINHVKGDYAHPDVPENKDQPFSLQAGSNVSDGVFRLGWTFRSDGGVIPPSGITDYLKARDAIMGATDRLYDFRHQAVAVDDTGKPTSKNLFLTVMIAALGVLAAVFVARRTQPR